MLSRFHRFTLLLLVALTVAVGAETKNIHEAIRAGDTAAVKSLLKQNPQLIKSRDGGASVLHAAARCQDKALLDLLIAAGADVNATQDSRMTPLHSCAQSNNGVLAALLIKNGAKLDLPDKDGKTALYWCAWEGSENVAKLLLDAGARTDSKDNTMKKTPLAAAKYRLSSYQKSSGGDYMARKILVVIQLLEQHGAKE